MNYEIPKLELPEDLEISDRLTPDERPKHIERNNPHTKLKDEDAPGPAFHQKIEKNSKENEGGSYRREIAAKYKKPKTRGDKSYNLRNKKKGKY
jgi:ATP-dependent RNA helicase RhlE